VERSRSASRGGITFRGISQPGQSEFAHARAAIEGLLADGRWRTASEVWRESGVERRWVTLVLRALRNRGEVELREAVTPAGQTISAYRLIRVHS